MMARILIVEDDVILRYTLAEWLRAAQHDVLEAASADEAKIILSSVLAVDLVVTDIQMPGSMNGLDLAEHVRTERPDLPVIVVSGGPYVNRPQTAAVTAFFPKPYDLEGLLSYIATLVPQIENTHQRKQSGGK